MDLIPEFNRSLREICLEAVEGLPEEIINFGHSYGAFWMLADLVLNESIREKHSWIMVDPFLPFWSYSGLSPPLGFLGYCYMIATAQICLFLKQKRTGFFNRLLKNMSLIFLRTTANCLSFFVKIAGYRGPNILEMLDMASLFEQAKYSSILKSIKNSVKLHLVGITSEKPEFSFVRTKGFATNYSIRDDMVNFSGELSIYAKHFLLLDGDHPYLETENGYGMLRQILDFSYRQRRKKT
jgi:hypothetical protein